MVSAANAAEPRLHALTLVQINDAYEIFPLTLSEPGRELRRGGMAHIATLLQHRRAAGPMLLLHAGDMISPSLLSNKLKHRGAQMITALNALGIDAATFGNHEFDFGCRVLAQRLAESSFPWVSANVELPAEMGLPPGKVKPYRILRAGGLRVGVFGLTLPLQPIPGCGPTPITFRKPLAAAREALAALKQARPDLIVALTHQRMAQDRALARALPEIDLIVGGHEHEPLQELVGKTLITKAGANATALGLIGVRAAQVQGEWITEKRWDLMPVDPAQWRADPRLSALLAFYERETRLYAEVIGASTVPLDAQESTVREAESNLGNYLADTARTALRTDVALINGGSIRDDRIIPPGPLTLADIHTLLPFDNRLVAVAISGERLRAALENGVSQVGEQAGRFPQVSGLRFWFDPERPAGRRIVRVCVDAEPLAPDRIYTLAATDFLVEGGDIDGYTMLPRKILREAGDFNEILIRRLREQGSISPQIEGRVVRVSPAVSPPVPAAGARECVQG